MIEQNKQFIHNIFGGTADRHGFICHPALIALLEVGDFTLSSEPIQKWVPWVVENYKREVKSLELLQDDNVPLAKMLTGTQLFANAFGCEVHIPLDNMPCALPLVSCTEEADKLEVPNIWKTECLYRVFELGDAVRRELGPDVDMGICDMQTGFDIANLIWDKNDLLCAMSLEPDAVKRLSAKCALLLKTFLIELRKEFPTMSPAHCPNIWVPPELGPWLSNDEAGIMSPEMFEEFCLPELNDLCDTFGGIGMHCCADAEHQFPEFNKIKNFYAFNRVESRHGYLPILEHFSGPDSPVHCLAWITDKEMEQLIVQASTGTRFIFVNMSEDNDNSAKWLAEARALSQS